MGDTFNIGPNSTVINRSSVVNSLNKVMPNFDGGSQAVLRGLTDKVLSSRNREAAELLEEFLSELNKRSPRKNILNSLLNGVVASLPSLAAATEIIENVRRIIAGF